MEKEARHFERIGNQIQYDYHLTKQYLEQIARSKIDPNFKFHESDEEILKRLFVYNIDDFKHCKLFGVDPRKGILLIGPVGCGKTTLMKVFSFLAHDHKKYVIKPTREITAEFIQDGFQVLSRYGKSYKGFCFDDLGVEQSIKHFGNECNVIGEILLSRYEYMKVHNSVTHSTTNLNANELEKIYGIRVRSRLREMFNVISFPSNTKDKRK
jgi:DNA replication protein DnaC